MIQTQITLPEEVMARIRAEAGTRGITPNLLMRILLCGRYRRETPEGGEKNKEGRRER